MPGRLKENINTIDPDTRADRAKYTFSKGTRYLQELLDMVYHLAIDGCIGAHEYHTLQDIVINVWRELYDATIFGNDEDDWYSNGCPVSSHIELPVEPSEIHLLSELPSELPSDVISPCALDPDGQHVGSFTYTWHPDREHPSNQRRELTGDEAPNRLYGFTEDGWGMVECDCRRKVLVVAPGHMDSVTESRPKRTR